METPYVIRVDEKGVQRICLADGTPIPAQVESALFQDTEQSKCGECVFNFMIFVNASPDFKSDYKCTIVDQWSIELPDGRICEMNHVTRTLHQGSPAAYCTTKAKLIPSIP